jgi:hypothetical protein
MKQGKLSNTFGGNTLAGCPYLYFVLKTLSENVAALVLISK